MEEDDQCRDASHTVEFAKVGEGMGLGYGGSSHLLDLFDHGRECGGINKTFQAVSLRDPLYRPPFRNLPTIGSVQPLVFNPDDRFLCGITSSVMPLIESGSPCQAAS